MTDRHPAPHGQAAEGMEVSVLHPATTFTGGRQVVGAGGEVLYSNDELVEPLQRYPGERLGDLARDRFPVPDRVGEYCDRETFLAAPKFMAQWVHWPERARFVLEGRYDELPPAHFEGIFTLVCNFMCPHCSRRVTRSRWVDGGTWDHNTPIEKRNTMHPEGLKRVIDQMAEMRVDDQMGIVWGGGDPTANPFTYEAMRYAQARGISASFLTNGVFLDAERVLTADPILVRISLNCGTEEAYQRFHGYPRGWDYFDRVRAKMRELARRKLELRARTLVGISLIVDERNFDDLVAAAEEIRAVVDDVGPGIDYVIVRPVMNYAHFEGQWARLQEDTASRAEQLIGPGGAVREILDDLGIPLVPIKDSFSDRPPDEEHGDGTCLAYGMAGEIRHNGDVQLCSDSYGNPDYTIGNLFSESLREIWTGDRRRHVLARVNERRCYATTCPHNSRGHHYNRLLQQVEALRRADRMADVELWVQDLRATTQALHHSFFL